MLSAICFNLDQSKILSSDNGLKMQLQSSFDTCQQGSCLYMFVNLATGHLIQLVVQDRKCDFRHCEKQCY